jgi:molecular chaperone GrpE
MSAERRDTRVAAETEAAAPAEPEEGPAVSTPSTAPPTSAAASPASEKPVGGSTAAANGADDGPSPGPSAEPSAGADTHDDGERVSLDLDELAAKAAERDEYLAVAQRTQADFENYRKRVARDAAHAEVRGIVRLAKELLPGLDNLERALAAQDGHNGQLAEGIQLVQAELIAALARVGLEAYSPLGERFDPELHEAVAQQPAGDDVESGTIIEVYQPGYRLEGNVIRPARVVVAA